MSKMAGGVLRGEDVGERNLTRTIRPLFFFCRTAFRRTCGGERGELRYVREGKVAILPVLQRVVL